MPEAIAKVLVFRGIDDYTKAKSYFRPTLELLHDPFLMDGMERAVGRILQAFDHHEKILVFGDYDVDGTKARSRAPAGVGDLTSAAITLSPCLRRCATS